MKWLDHASTACAKRNGRPQKLSAAQQVVVGCDTDRIFVSWNASTSFFPKVADDLQHDTVTTSLDSFLTNTGTLKRQSTSLTQEGVIAGDACDCDSLHCVRKLKR